MKLWEVLKELEENRDKKYKTVSKFGKIHEIGLYNDGYYAFSSIFNGKNIDDKPGGGFGGNIYQEADWQEIKQPVTWQEAIEAWMNGEPIKCVLEESVSVFDGEKINFRDSRSNAVDKVQLRNGTWYIED